MDALVLSRVQFGVSVGLHYLFPITTLGLTLFILIFETVYLLKRLESYRAASVFLTQLLGLVFTVGVATGLMLPFSFGANWARFSTYAGPVFGTMISIEATTAFALESAFIAILLFGRNRVSPFVCWIAAVCVFLGAHASAFLIVAANSWLQTPAGFGIQDGQLVVTGFRDAILNHSTLIRFVHVVTAAWLTGALAVAGIAAYYALRNRHGTFVATTFRIAIPLALIMAVAQPLGGHLHILNVLEHNPEKSAAYEGVFHTTNGATFYAFGVPDEKDRTVRFGIGIPRALSWLESGDPLGRVRGLDEYPEDTWPPVRATFVAFRLMVLLGMAMVAIAGVGAYLLWRKRLLQARWYLAMLPWVVPLPYVANELGWIGAEIGRQPWLIYRVLRTADASSIVLPGWQIATSLAGVVLVYSLLVALTLFFVGRQIRRGPTSG